MKEIIINRNEFNAGKEMYDVIQKKFDLPDWFGKNPPALWDMLTGHIDTNCKVVLVGFNRKEKEYDKYVLDFIIECFKEAAELDYLKDEFFFEMRDV